MISRQYSPASVKSFTKCHDYRKRPTSRFPALSFGKNEEHVEEDEIPLLSLESDCFRHRGSPLSRDGVQCHSRNNQFSHEVTDTTEKTPRRGLTEYLDYEIQNGDTLQSVSVRHGCSITDLKQANNWFSDQDFYAQKTIRIPTRPHSILLESLSGAEPGRSNRSPSSKDEIGTAEKRTVCVGIGRILDAERTTASDEFLCKMDLDLMRIREKTKLYKESLDEVVASLNTPQIGPLVVVPKTTSSCNGADCGISWWSLLIVLIVVGLIVPLFYVVYLKMTTGKDSKILGMMYNQTHYYRL